MLLCCGRKRTDNEFIKEVICVTKIIDEQKFNNENSIIQSC